MSAFSPEFTKVFKAASFANLYSSFPLIAIRVGSTLVLALLTLSSYLNGSNSFYTWASILLVLVMLEFFYRWKVLNELNSKSVLDISPNDNSAEIFALSSARAMLRSEDWKNVSKLLYSLSKDNGVEAFFEKINLQKDELHSLIKASTKEVLEEAKIINSAKDFAIKEQRSSIDQLDLLLALFTLSSSLQKVTFNNLLKEEDLVNIAYWVRHLYEKSSKNFWEKSPYSFGLGLASFWEGGWTLETEKFTRSITLRILGGVYKEHLVGRREIIRQVEETLARSEKRNVVLLGEAGVGKTAVVYGLAEKSIHAKLPKQIRYKRFLELNLSSLLSNASNGVLEERISNLFSEISHAKDVVLYIPQLELLTTSEGGGVDITGLLNETLQGENIQIIGSTTASAYKNFIEGKSVFAESFEIVEISQPGRDESIRILEEAATNSEIKNKIVITYKSLEEVVDLTNRYMPNKVLPGKAIDVLDEAVAALVIRKEKILKPEMVEQIISQKTKTPVKLAEGAEAKQLLNLEEEIHKRIIDQEEAVKSISSAVRRARTLKRETTRPIGVFLFLGPTGVGKTETAKALASVYFGSEERIIRLDMSEYQTEQSLNRLIGPPPGSKEYSSGGQLTESVRKNPFTVILIDELEKAHQSVQDALLPIFDEGKITDSAGKNIVFTNTIIIATSNAGAEYIRESIQKGISIGEIKKVLLEKLQREEIFKPEFLNRFDDIIVFKPLSSEEINQVVTLLINKLKERMKSQDISLTLDETAINWLAQKGYDPTYGARPLRRLIQSEVEEALSKKILSGELKRGGNITVSASGNNLIINPKN